MTDWSTRRGRALVLAAETAHAEEILRCYAQVTEAQERVASRLRVGDWMAAIRTGGGGRTSPPTARGPALALPHLPLGELLPFFDAFLAEMSDVGTAVMVAEAAALAGAPSPERRAVVATALGDEDAAAASFHARAFAEIVATTLAARVLPAAGTRSPGGGYEPDDAAPARCRVCGALPVVATLRDQPGALGSRGLVCSRCGTERRFRRLTCAWCGESSADRLTIHSPESVPHVRLDECGSCRRYMKTIDLRRRGDAVPIVEDLATPELDLWAAEAGLARVRESLFGLRAID